MEDKKQDVNSLEELFKVVNAYSGWFANLADELSKVLADIKAPVEEENTWEMKCPYEKGDELWCLYSYGGVYSSFWADKWEDKDRFNTGNTFPTKQAAELEVKRRKLLTRFRAFRDECNNGWKPNWTDVMSKKYYVFYSEIKNRIYVTCVAIGNHYHTFGYFENEEDAYKAIDLFGDEIKELFVEGE